MTLHPMNGIKTLYRKIHNRFTHDEMDDDEMEEILERTTY